MYRTLIALLVHVPDCALLAGCVQDCMHVPNRVSRCSTLWLFARLYGQCAELSELLLSSLVMSVHAYARSSKLLLYSLALWVHACAGSSELLLYSVTVCCSTLWLSECMHVPDRAKCCSALWLCECMHMPDPVNSCSTLWNGFFILITLTTFICFCWTRYILIWQGCFSSSLTM